MGTNSLIDKTDPHEIVASDWNEIHTALAGDMVGRVKTGATSSAASNQKLGTQALPWGQAHISSLFVGGKLIDFSNIGGGGNTANGVISSATRSTSSQPDFLRADGTAASVTVLGAITSLSYNVANIGVVISTDISVTNLTTAPSTNNTCAINDSGLSNQSWTVRHGEGQSIISINAAGSEITDRIGQYASFKASTGEIFYGFINSSTEIIKCFRGFYLDSSGAEAVRETLADNEILTLMATNWIFAEDNGTTVSFTDTSPVVSAKEPASPLSNSYWFDVVSQQWKRYDGTQFEPINRTLIGYAVCDGSACVGSRSADYAQSYSDEFFMVPEIFSVSVVQDRNMSGNVSVYSQNINYSGGFSWDITTDLESGLTEANSTLYYLYMTEEGLPKISTMPPYQLQDSLKGYYHPHQSWRCLAVAYNDSSGDFVFTSAMDDAHHKRFSKIDVIDEFHVSAPLSSIMFAPMTDEYDFFTLEGAGITGSTSANLYLAVSANYGQSVLTNSHYSSVAIGSSYTAGGASSSVINTNCSIGTASSGRCRAGISVIMRNPNGNERNGIEFKYLGGGSATPGTGHRVSGVAVKFNGIRISASSGNIVNGNFVLYGHRKKYDERFKFL